MGIKKLYKEDKTGESPKEALINLWKKEGHLSITFFFSINDRDEHK